MTCVATPRSSPRRARTSSWWRTPSATPIPCRSARCSGVLVAETARLPIGAHFHDTRGLGLANVAAALDCGIRSFDASLAGLGGCPFAPGATGNIVMEDLCFMLDSMGMRTGVDLEKLLAAREIPARNLDPGRAARRPRASGTARNYVPAAERAPAPA